MENYVSMKISDSNDKSLVIIPTYNERDNIEELITKIFNLKLKIDLLVIDDNSPDGTGSLLEKLKEKYEGLKVIHRPKKLGLGSAYIEGFKFALEHPYDNVITMDADLSHNPEIVPEIINKLKENHLVIGSRYVKGGGIIGWKAHRKFLSYFGNLYARTITRLPTKDCTSGFMGIQKTVLENININDIHSEGYGFLIELKYRIFKKNYRICELPIIFVDRTAGKSKISKLIILEAFFLVFKLRFLSKIP